MRRNPAQGQAQMTATLEQLRKSLHQSAEPSGSETHTAQTVSEVLRHCHPTQLETEIAGTGVVAAFEGKHPGPRVLVRCELDAIPVPETLDIPHGSRSDDVSHKCGHDGHMAIVLGVARALSKSPVSRGSVVLAFQPAEETGQGAAAMVSDPRFAPFRPDRVFALHNLPGYALGTVILRPGVFASGSKGLIVVLQGETSHAAEPHQGRSPALAVAQLISGFSAAPQVATALHEAAQVTVIHAKLGDVAFGTSPGKAVVMATLRAHDTATMSRLEEHCVGLARGVAQTFGLQVLTRIVEEFPVTRNDPDAVSVVKAAAQELSLPVFVPEVPFAWSEDFGHFTAAFPGALFGLGSGENHPPLHHPDYDFPDALIDVGVSLFLRIIQRSLES